jgi:NADPH-dependent 2,4-dienoyl-CoA reductase/sulfur reductase-like enzyme
MLRREGYEGPVTLVTADADPPYDRPNVSKDYLAGNAPDEWMPLRGEDWYAENAIELLVGHQALKLDAGERKVHLEDGRILDYGALLLATGATPVHLDTPGGDQAHVFYLRSMRDSRAIIAGLEGKRRAVVVGASFIGLEVAASLRARDIEVHVVAPEAVPMERVLGPQLGSFIRSLHEEHGVVFHLGQTLTQIAQDSVTLKDGGTIEADVVVFGVGVRPDLALAEQAGLRVDKGIVVDEYLKTSAENVWAAGDAARWPDPHTGQAIRVEHWVVAERQGQTAARNMLGRREKFDAVPFFWSQHYDVPVNYVGHAEEWDRIDVAGSIDDRDCAVAYVKGGKTLAVASIYRDDASLQAELAMEQGDQAALSRLVPPNS